MRLSVLAATAALVLPAAAEAQEIRPLLDFRLRWEKVDQDDFDCNENAFTLRGRAGAELTSGDWSILAEGEGTAALVQDYDSGLNSKTAHEL